MSKEPFPLMTQEEHQELTHDLRGELQRTQLRLQAHERERQGLFVLLRQLRDYALEWPKGSYTDGCRRDDCVVCGPIREWCRVLADAQEVLNKGGHG